MAELLFVPFKKSSDVDLVKPLKNLIQSSNSSGENQEDYSEALNELSRLRTNAIWKVFEKSSLDVIYSYYDQLVSLEGKVPPQEVQIPFKWKDAFDKGSIFGGRMSLTISSLAYERVCVLFNAGAAQSALAAQQPLDTEDSLKLAAKLLQQAAGVFGWLRGHVLLAVHQDTTPDLQPDTLDALARLMLAQAQEVIAYKCIRDEMKDAMVAKVCAAGEELYTEALRAMQKEPQRSLWDRDWISTVSAKQQAMRGLTQLHQAGVARAAGAVGEEIARLTVAAEALRGAAQRAGGAPRLAELGSRAARRLAAALKDNDFIYHERVPEPGALEPVARAAVAKALPPAERLGAPGGRDLFAALVPLRVRGALAASDARRADLVAAEVARLRDATQLLNSVLASLNLPACLEEGEGGALPDSILAKAAAVRAAGGAAALRRLMDELPELLQRNRDILDEADRMLREEADADASLRDQFGARWTRTDSAALTGGFRANGDKYRQIIDNAVRADEIVRDKFRLHEGNVERLSGGAEALLAAVPAAEGGVPRADAAPLRALMREVDALKAERDALEAPRGGLAGGAGGAAGARAGGARGARRAGRGGGARLGAGCAGGRARRLPGAHRQPHRGHQVLQRPHAAAGRVPEQGGGLLLRAQDGEGGAAEGPDAGGVPARAARRAAAARAPRRRAVHGAGRRREEGATGAAAAPRGRRLLAAVPGGGGRHAAPVRRGAVPVLRAGAHAAPLQPVRDAAVPERGRGAHAARAALRALPAPARAAPLPAGSPARVQPLPAAVAPLPAGSPARVQPLPAAVAPLPAGSPARVQPLPAAVAPLPAGSPVRVQPLPAPQATYLALATLYCC